VVLNAILTSGHDIIFTDNIDWVGDSYIFHTYNKGLGFKIIDSAQKVEQDQFKKEAEDNDLMVFSFYPTKPVGGCDGGMVVSNNKEAINILRSAAMNGMGFSVNSWERTPMFPGYKMYMNSLQACIALKSLSLIDSKKRI
jgi:dTDP-4-amino-4,6-dideoxygalactose transaminase